MKRRETRRYVLHLMVTLVPRLCQWLFTDLHSFFNGIDFTPRQNSPRWGVKRQQGFALKK
jgi:hypothetical protein